MTISDNNTFKKMNNTSRIFTSEEQFSLGMSYIDSPIAEGGERFLLNFDIADDNLAIKPRAGIRTDKIIIPDVESIESIDTNEFDFNDCVICAISDTEYPNSNSRYVVLSHSGKILIGTIKTNVDVYTGVTNEQGEVIPGLSMSVYNPNLTFSSVIPYSNCDIHGYTTDLNKYTMRAVGTKAWNDSYFFFAIDSQNEISLYNIIWNNDSLRFEANKVVPTTLTALEATPNKFNMLSEQPYNFENSIIPGAFIIQGVLPYLDNELIVSPKINTNYKYKLCYSAPANTKYEVKWEWKDYNGTEFTEIKKEVITMPASNAPDIYCNFAAPIKQSLMRVTITGYTGDTINTYPDQVSAIGVECDSEIQNSTANRSLKNYNLNTPMGMCYWQNRLVLWGFEDPILFTSEPNLPEWFAYPKGIDMFEEPIIHCEPYLDNLLVFTTSKLFKLTMLTDGSGWTKTCIQTNLRLTEYDTNFIKTIKNMVFFKSGNSFYMVVPSASNVNNGGLTIAPIGKPIQSLLDNFKETVEKLLLNVYSFKDTINLTTAYSYINESEIIINYLFGPNLSKYINFCLIYDTDNRTWRTHVFESKEMYQMYQQDATTNGTLVSLSKFRYDTEETTFIIQMITRNKNIPKDYAITNGVISKITNKFISNPELDTRFKNYQYLDTGFRTLGYPNNKKRYREFQLRINNKDKKTLKFGTGFFIDDETRKSLYVYEPLEVYNANTGCIDFTYIKTPIIEVAANGYTILADTNADINSWKLDSSVFSDQPLIKVRTAVSGKGYNQKLVLLSVNESNYELLGLCWVYKIKNLR